MRVGVYRFIEPPQPLRPSQDIFTPTADKTVRQHNLASQILFRAARQS